MARLLLDFRLTTTLLAVPNLPVCCAPSSYLVCYHTTLLTTTVLFCPGGLFRRKQHKPDSETSGVGQGACGTGQTRALRRRYDEYLMAVDCTDKAPLIEIARRMWDRYHSGGLTLFPPGITVASYEYSSIILVALVTKSQKSVQALQNRKITKSPPKEIAAEGNRRRRKSPPEYNHKITKSQNHRHPTSDI